MFPISDPSAPAVPPVVVAALITAVNTLHPDGSDAALIDQIALLEHLKSSCAAAQATLTHAFSSAQIADGADATSPPTGPAAASPGRSRWPATNPATAADASSAWPPP